MKTTKYTLVALVIFLVICCKTEKSKTITPLASFADSVLQASIDSIQIAGAAILAHQNGKTILKKLYGYVSLELSTPMPSDSVFEITYFQYTNR
ncbi:hypothetical protein [Mariniflexile sp.]|uniref:hypothetical protein n=1 Tax=Mariniflexile sp. TaxID=1979402 RepID=UPI004047BED8